MQSKNNDATDRTPPALKNSQRLSAGFCQGHQHNVLYNVVISSGNLLPCIAAYWRPENDQKYISILHLLAKSLSVGNASETETCLGRA